MNLSVTSFREFWDNPERYRLVHQKNWVPAETPFSLERGISMHVALQVMGAGGTEEETLDMLIGAKPRPDGRVEALTNTRALSEGVGMAKALLPLPAALAREAYFQFPVSLHNSGHGIIDFIRADEVIVEFKSVNPRASYSQKEKDWNTDPQADFELLGAAALGIKRPRLIVQYVQEPSKRGEDWKVWEPVPVVRTPAQLEVMRNNIEVTASMIQGLIQSPGIDHPWPHLENWKCGENCPFRGVCGHITSDFTQPPPGFRTREDYLKAVKAEMKRLEVLV